MLVEFEDVLDLGLLPCPARAQPLAHEIGPIPNQFDVEHRRIIGMTPNRARRFGRRRRPAVPAAARTTSSAASTTGMAHSNALNETDGWLPLCFRKSPL